MALKFDGKCLKESSKILCNVKGNTIWEGSAAYKALANVRGDTIWEGSAAYKALIKTSDAARKIGATSRGPLTAAIWYLFCR
jgi:hypothetical protein